MNWKKIICICVVFVAAIVVSDEAVGQYTAKTFIQVLPYAEKDPFVIETPAINENIQYGLSEGPSGSKISVRIWMNAPQKVLRIYRRILVPVHKKRGTILKFR
ncbi:MAG: hypothetical protein ACYS8Y_00940 [Planctomycetota bacterium]